MFLSRMTVAARLYAGFALILALLVVVTGVAVVKVSRIDQALRDNNNIHVQVQRYAINFRGSAHDRSIAVRDVVLSPTPAERDKEIATIAALADFYAQSATPLEKLVNRVGAPPELAPLYAGIRSAEAQAVASTRAIIAQVQAGDAQAAQTLWQQAKPQYVQWLAAINKLIDFKEARIQEANHSAMQEADSFLSVMFSALALALVLSAAVAWTVARSIVCQLGAEPVALAEVASHVAEGDLQPVAGAAQAEPGSVLASLAAMQASLARVVGQVRVASNAVTQGSEEIAGGNIGLLQRTEEQASNLQHAASSMEQMTASVKNNADSARQATQVATLASEAAHQLLPTIRSRCLAHTMTWPAQADGQQWLQARGIAAEDAATALQAAGGRPGDALRMAADAGKAAAWAQLPRQLAKGDVAALAAFAPVDAVQALQKICHDLMALAGGGEPRYFSPADLPGKPLPMALLAEWSRELVQAARTADHPFNAGLMTEALASRARAVLISGKAARAVR